MRQHLSPQMRQSLNVLQAASMDLRQMVSQQMVENPVLELESPETSLEEAGLEGDMDDREQDDEFDRMARLDDDWRDLMSQQRSVQRLSSEEEERRQFLLDSITETPSLAAHIESQLGVIELTEQEKEDIERLIGHLDDRGYLDEPLEDISLQEGIPLIRLEEAKVTIQSLDPAGLASTDLRECLMQQLRRQRQAGSLAYQILDLHFDLLAKRHMSDIARKLKVSPDDVAEAAEQIASLNPSPARDFDVLPAGLFVQSDVTVKWQDGAWQVTLNKDTTPRLRISNHYKDLMSSGGTGEDVRSYIREKIKNGKFFIQCLEQRQQTILKIANEIVSRQSEFLEHGPAKLKPMNMAQVAEAVGVHETTISRAVGGKYMATPQGVFEMRWFFTTGLATESGESMSNTSVKQAVAAAIKAEDPAKPLSDDKIVNVLAEQGIKLARRTVVKYREELGLLPSHLRRKR